MGKKVYIVNYKETEIDSEGVPSTECGTCEFAYESEAEAVRKVGELAQLKAEECVEEMGYPEDEVSIELTDDVSAKTVVCGSNTYFYNVLELPVV